MKPTQLQFIEERLRSDGYISRNTCLQNYISRLGARILDLQKEGWEFEGEFVKTEYGRDYVYKVRKAPELTLFK